MTKSLMVGDRCIAILELYSTHASIIHQAERPIMYYKNNACYILLQHSHTMYEEDAIAMPVWTEQFSDLPEKIIVRCNINRRDQKEYFQQLARPLCLKECMRGLDLADFVRKQPVTFDAYM